MNASSRIPTIAWLELSLLALIWGAVFLAVRVALDEVPFVTSVAHRVGWATLALWIIVLIRGEAVPRGWRIWAALLVMGLLNNVIPFSLMAWGQLHIESGLTSILNATTALFGVTVAAMLLPDERLTLRRGAGVVIGFGGVVIVIGPEALSGFDLTSLGQIAVLLGTLSYAFAGVWARKRLGGLPPIVAAAGMLTGSSLIALPAAFILDGTPSFDLMPQTWGAILYYALAATAGAYLLYYRIIARVGSGNLMLVTLIMPPIAITLGALVLGEALTANAFLGFGVIALGLLVLNGRVLSLFKRGHAR
ncbi:drug/metabolite transporter (DMT)-like permease [Rubricella aquisinus]|uniref:Drug/metabolite transporter (DMT)-like permease n=1 Tax=Rubricella aquisinus TaxID=2028108 RepID=A0A840X540_9RHOB|nr:DMT family transporter [Rubricella aquisinus]MBB5515817.1 drug/metabolite transporter (DMT)-like permease [Rubricella aquisinus]